VNYEFAYKKDISAEGVLNVKFSKEKFATFILRT
jgi:hypothetical protein